MLEDVPVHSRTGAGKAPSGSHQRNLSLDFRHLNPINGAITCGHQRNRSLDSVLQRIPEDTTPVSPGVAPLTLPPSGSDDSGIHAPHDPEPPREEITARSRESLDSGNPEDVETDQSKQPDEMMEKANAERAVSADLTAEQIETQEIQSAAKNRDCLLRLFESPLFDASMAISYLFNSEKQTGVQSYLGNKLFSFKADDIDFYLPQLSTMFAQMSDVADILKPYLAYRCRSSVDFSMRLVWLLAAFGSDDEKSRASVFKEQILSEELRPQPGCKLLRGHHRSQSDASVLRNVQKNNLGDLASGRAFDNGCNCSGTCECGAPRLAPEIHFITALVDVGRRLCTITDKEMRNERLRSELAAIDLNLPARVWLPTTSKPHYLLRIPPQAATSLNSKDKAPYIVYVEVLESDDGGEPPPLPPRSLPPAPPPPNSPPIRQTKSEENLVPEWPSLSVCRSVLDDVDADGIWSPEDDELVATYNTGSLHSDQISLRSVMSTTSATSYDSTTGVVCAGSIRRNLEAVEAATEGEFRHDPHDPSARTLKETWQHKRDRLRSSSPYGHLPAWRLIPAIVKVGDDLRQELLASQFLQQLASIWERERVPLILRPYKILCLDATSGLIEPVLNSVSLHQIKRQSGKKLREWLILEHGEPTSEGFMQAQRNFVESAAAYSIVSYLLQLKDRHNGNILLDSQGHIVHIDFGFILSKSPKNLGFESSPFKLTWEMVEVLDGEGSDMFQYFKLLILKGLLAARKHMKQLLDIVEIMKLGGQISCLRNTSAVPSLRSRFHHGKTDAQLSSLVDKMVSDALHSISTRLYDNYQYYTNGIL